MVLEDHLYNSLEGNMEKRPVEEKKEAAEQANPTGEQDVVLHPLIPDPLSGAEPVDLMNIPPQPRVPLPLVSIDYSPLLASAGSGTSPLPASARSPQALVRPRMSLDGAAGATQAPVVLRPKDAWMHSLCFNMDNPLVCVGFVEIVHSSYS
jgi:hypothetical protein